MNLKRKCYEGTHYLSCRQFSGSTFGSLVSKWKNYFNYCTALNYSLWGMWWQVCRAITLPLPLASLSLLMKKPLHTTQSERDRERAGFCSLTLKFVAMWFSTEEKEETLGHPRSSASACPKIWRLKSEKTKIYSQQLKINWICVLLLDLLTACRPINSPSVLLQWFATGSKAQTRLALADIPSTNISGCHVWKYIAIIAAKKNT